jgi:hypothetical protein
MHFKQFGLLNITLNPIQECRRCRFTVETIFTIVHHPADTKHAIADCHAHAELDDPNSAYLPTSPAALMTSLEPKYLGHTAKPSTFNIPIISSSH